MKNFLKLGFGGYAPVPRTTLLLALAFAAALSTAHAYNFTIGYSGLSQFNATPTAAQATFNAENAATGQTSSNCSVGDGFFSFSIKDDKGWVTISWNNMNISHIPIKETSAYNGILSNGVVTVRGETFSRFYNCTSQDLTINETSIPANTSATIDCPWYVAFSGAGTNSYSLVSAKTGEQVLTIADNSKKSFLPSADDIVICNDYTGGTNATVATKKLFTPLYGGIKSENQDKILYAENESPIYRESFRIKKTIYLYVEWQFSKDDWGASPAAYINDTCVCLSHNTEHIIDYKINGEDLIFADSPVSSLMFTAYLEPQEGYSGGDCVMRCWDTSYSAFNEAPKAHRAAISAGTGVATFKYTINANTGEWKVEPQ